MKVYELPEGAKNSKGRALQNLLNIEPGDQVNAFIRCKQLDDPEFTGSHFLVFATANGIVKKTSLTEYARVMAKGKKAIVIREGDSLIGVELTDGNSELLLANRNGRAIRFHESKLRSMGRVSTGVRGMKLDGGDDAVIGLIAMNAETENNVMVLSQEGFGKRSLLDHYRITNRGGKGVKTMNVTDKTGRLVAFKSVNDDNDLVIINKSGITLRIHVASVRVMGRATQGVRIINLDKRNDVIASVCCVDADPEEEVTEVIDGEELPDLIDEPIVEDAETEDDAEAETEDNNQE
jgi:DNA gyrase subunit A